MARATLSDACEAPLSESRLACKNTIAAHSASPGLTGATGYTPLPTLSELRQKRYRRHLSRTSQRDHRSLFGARIKLVDLYPRFWPYPQAGCEEYGSLLFFVALKAGFRRSDEPSNPGPRKYSPVYVCQRRKKHSATVLHNPTVSRTKYVCATR